MPTLKSLNLTDLYTHAAARAEALEAGLARGGMAAADVAAMRAAVESLPLTTEAVVAARNRLDNACRYAAAGEVGAARYELRLLAQGLCPKEKPVAAKARSRGAARTRK